MGDIECPSAFPGDEESLEQISASRLIASFVAFSASEFVSVEVAETQNLRSENVYEKNAPLSFASFQFYVRTGGSTPVFYHICT